MSKSELIEGVEAKQLANAIRALAMDAVEQAKSGHPGMPMGMADAATVLFAKFLKFDAAEPNWPDRDRFVLSAGHGSMLLYALLYLTGNPDITLDEIKRFRQLGSKTAGHPENFLASGIETTTGPLGQGLANAVGMAMAEAHLNARFGDDLVDHRTWVIAGDGCLMEGVSQEAIALAGRQRLNKLIVIWDDNSISIDGAVPLSDNTDQKMRFAASGWNVLACDGHNMKDVERACVPVPCLRSRARPRSRPGDHFRPVLVLVHVPVRAGGSVLVSPWLIFGHRKMRRGRVAPGRDPPSDGRGPVRPRERGGGRAHPGRRPPPVHRVRARGHQPPRGPARQRLWLPRPSPRRAEAGGRAARVVPRRFLRLGRRWGCRSCAPRPTMARRSPSPAPARPIRRA
jgi:transketolase N-terminal domain/subunit